MIILLSKVSLLTVLLSCGYDFEMASRNAVYWKPKACMIRDYHFAADVPVNLGQGIVGETFGQAISLGMFSSWTATSCSNGEQMEVIFQSVSYSAHPVTHETQTKVHVPYRPELESEFLARIEDFNGATLSELRELAQSIDLMTRSYSVTEETCGCAAFYPELLGDKTPSENRMKS